MNSTFISNSELTNQAKPFQVLNRTHLLLCLIEWCCHRGIQTNVLQMSNEELDDFTPKQEPKQAKNTVAHLSSASETPLRGISLPTTAGH